MLYERGDLIGQLAFTDLRKQALVNEKAKAANDDRISRVVFAIE
jgi:hypothetical protein